MPDSRTSTARYGDCLAIVPALDEQDSVAAVVREVGSLPGVDVLVVDDGSTDDTAAVARAAGARVVSMPFNVGIGGAVQTGYMWALQHGYSVAIQVDGDGQHPAIEVRRLVDAGQRADLAHDRHHRVLLVERRDDRQAVAVPGSGGAGVGHGYAAVANGRSSLAGGPASPVRRRFGEC